MKNSIRVVVRVVELEQVVMAVVVHKPPRWLHSSLPAVTILVTVLDYWSPIRLDWYYLDVYSNRRLVEHCLYCRIYPRGYSDYMAIEMALVVVAVSNVVLPRFGI